MNQTNVFKKGLYHWRILLERGNKIYFYNSFILPFCVAVDRKDLALFDESYSYWLKKLLAISFLTPMIILWLLHVSSVGSYVYNHPVMYLYFPVDIVNIVNVVRSVLNLYMPYKRISFKLLNPFSRDCNFTYYPNSLSVVIFLVESYVLIVSVFLLAKGPGNSFLMNAFYLASLFLALPIASLSGVGVWKLLRHDY
nr:hypothetical protein [Acidithiobacillus ferruginosus]